jgi:hypothetical protein
MLEAVPNASKIGTIRRPTGNVAGFVRAKNAMLTIAIKMPIDSRFFIKLIVVTIRAS